MKLAIKWTKNLTTLQVEQLIRAEKDIKKAITIFDTASNEYRNGYKHDHATFGLMIKRLVSANQFKSAENLVERMREEQCGINEDVFLSICRGYGRVHKPMEAVRVIESMKDMKEFESGVSERCYVTLLSILVDENEIDKAVGLFRYLKEIGIKPSVVSLNLLIKAMCKKVDTVDGGISMFREMGKHGCEPDSYSYGTLISGLCKFGRVEEASDLFWEMEEKGFVPTVVTYSCLINGLCKTGELGKGLSLFEEMARKGFKPNVFTFSCVMDGLCKSGRSLQARDLLDAMAEQRLSPNTITYGTLIHGLCNDGHLGKALELFDRMKLNGFKPDAGLYGKIISKFCDLRKFHEASHLLDEMLVAGISPNRLTRDLHVRTHNTVIRGLCEIDINRAFHLYMRMRTRGLSVEPGVFGAFIKVFCKKSNFDKACLVLDHMVCDGCVPDEKVWRAILNCDERKMTESVILLESLLELDELEELFIGWT